MITIPEMEFQGGLPDGGLLAGCLRQQLAGAGRLARLYAYYRGEHDIQGRVRGAGLPNLRLAHAYPRYISTMGVRARRGQARLGEPECGCRAARTDVKTHGTVY